MHDPTFLHAYHIRTYAHTAADETMLIAAAGLQMGDLAEKKTLASALRNAPRPRRSSLAWISPRLLGGGRADVPKITRVWFSWDDQVTEYDPSDCPHTVNPRPFLEMTTSEDEQGRKVEKYSFAYTPNDEDTLQVHSPASHSSGQQTARRISLHFDNANPRWSEHADGTVRSRLLCVRYNRAKSSLDGAFFIENRALPAMMPEAVSAYNTHNTTTAYVRSTADSWATNTDTPCDSTCLASGDYVHRFSILVGRDGPADSAVELCLSFNIGDHQYWDSNGGGNYMATFH